MPSDKHKLLDLNIPLTFADGADIYKSLGQKFVRHNKGLFVLAPSGSGKTRFVRAQRERHWLDGDLLWQITNAHPGGAWWLEDMTVIKKIQQRCDVITEEAKRMGFWVIGASNAWLKPDAIVVPDWETHRNWIRERESTPNAIRADETEIKKHREWIMRWREQGVPKFGTVEEATDFLAKL